ncbi:hypothetical protein M3Y97_00178600 [Aphelenchoides bicaudatus]|nr:hypothetical protein M3Y97_00178600 [Aphelenchoides bicaudatus]
MEPRQNEILTNGSNPVEDDIFELPHIHLSSPTPSNEVVPFIIWHFIIGWLLILRSFNVVTVPFITDFSYIGGIVVGVLHLINIFNFSILVYAMIKVWQNKLDLKFKTSRYSSDIFKY